MIIVLPPSETKKPSGDGPPLTLARLSFPELNTVRERLISRVTALSREEGRAALGLSLAQEEELERNLVLRHAPTSAAVDRYTGVLYDALGTASLCPAARSRLFVCSALFGLLGAEDPIPAYRLSGGSKLPGVGGLPAVWRPVLSPVLSSFDGLVVDLRSGAYAALAPLAGAITVRVVTADNKVVSHHNKSTKGKLARVLAASPVSCLPELIDTARAAGLAATPTGQSSMDIVFRP